MAEEPKAEQPLLNRPPAPPNRADSKEFWTADRREEHRLRGVAHEMAKAKKWEEARAFMKEHNLVWPPFATTPKPVSEALTAAARANGAKGGAPLGNKNSVGNASHSRERGSLPRAQDVENLIDITAEAIATGRSVRNNPALIGPITAQDRQAIVRLTKLTVEEFNERLTDKLSTFADKALDKMLEKLEQDKFRPSELSFALAVAMDKRQHLAGKNALSNAAVNIQVNNFGHVKTKEELIRSLMGEAAKSEPINVNPEPQKDS